MPNCDQISTTRLLVQDNYMYHRVLYDRSKKTMWYDYLHRKNKEDKQMTPIQEAILKIFNEAKKVLQNEKEETIRSVQLIGQLDRDNAVVNLGILNMDKFIAALGISRKKYYTRVYADRIIRQYPELLKMWRDGDTNLSCIALLHPKITEANSEKVLTAMKGKSKKDLEFFLSTVDFSGESIPREETIETRITFTRSEFEKIERAKDVLAAAGHTPDTKEAILKAFDDLLSKRDPMLKAERAKQRKTRKMEKKSAGNDNEPVPPGRQSEEKRMDKPTISFDDSVSPGTQPFGMKVKDTIETCEPVKETCPINKRKGGVKNLNGGIDNSISPGTWTLINPKPIVDLRFISASVRHQVWIRDKGRCTYASNLGESCGQTRMLELEHIIPVCRGGEGSLENITLRCRFHNQQEGRRLIGSKYFSKYEKKEF